jgi:hypothetical protein
MVMHMYMYIQMISENMISGFLKETFIYITICILLQLLITVQGDFSPNCIH